MRSAIILACVWASLQTAPHDTAVTSVRISVRPTSVDRLRMTIENRRDSPLLESTVELFEPGATHARSSIYMNLGGYLGGSDAPMRHGPIAPHERRVIEVDAPDPQVRWTPALVAVAFADNYYEGSLDVLTAWREARQKQADELAYWIRAFDAVPRESVEAARKHLADHAVERAGQDAAPDGTLRDRVWNLSRDDIRLPDLIGRVDREREAAARQLARLRPSLTGKLSPRPVTSAAISAEPAPATKYVVVIENAGKQPLEAWGWEYLDPRTGKPGGGVSTDMCGVPAVAEPGIGRVAPGEVREYPFGQTVSDGKPPAVRLKYVLFQDLSFEGAPSERDALLRERERRADDIAYAIGVLRRAAADPAQALAVLTAARSERARQLQEQGRHGSLSQLDELIRQAKASVTDFAAQAAVRETALQLEREQNLRHLNR
jgi:hypothetical protein